MPNAPHQAPRYVHFVFFYVFMVGLECVREAIKVEKIIILTKVRK